MRRFMQIILPLGLILGSVAIVLGLVELAKSKHAGKKPEANSTVLVDTITAHQETLTLTVVSQGTVRPRTETTLVTEVAGTIVDVSANFVAGGFFHQGEVLLQIDPSDYETGVKRAEANLASKKAQYADQKARSEQALKDWRNLGRQGEPSDLTLHKPQLAEALAAVQAAEADLQKAKRDLMRTRITLPYDGLVRTKQVGLGQYVGPGTPLGVTFSIATAEIRLPLTSRELAYLQLPSATGMDESRRPPVRLTAGSSGISGEWQAEIVRTEGVVDETSRVIYAVAQVMDPYALLGRSRQPELRMGTFVRAEIQGRRVESVIVLPRSVLRANDTVLVANREHKLEIRDVEVLRAEPETVYITAGIRSGERVISTAMAVPIPGTLLAFTDETATPEQAPSGETPAAGTNGQP